MGNVIYGEFEQPQTRLEKLTIQFMRLFWTIIWTLSILGWVVAGLILLNYFNIYLIIAGYRV